LQSTVAEQTKDAIVPEMVASRLAGVGHATDGQSVQDRRCRVHVRARARLLSAFRRSIFAAAGLHSAAPSTVTIFAATVTARAATVTVTAATVTVPATTVAAAIVAATAATATDAQTTASSATTATYGENRR